MDFYECRERRGESADLESERLAHELIGAAIEVHNHLGPGHAESTYVAALCHELELRGIPPECEVPVQVFYKGKRVGKGFIDLLVANRLVAEAKSVEHLTDVHKGQTLAYLTARDLRLGLLINFNVASLRQGIKRVVRDPPSPSSLSS